jgi:hypothetical protein
LWRFGWRQYWRWTSMRDCGWCARAPTKGNRWNQICRNGKASSWHFDYNFWLLYVSDCFVPRGCRLYHGFSRGYSLIKCQRRHSSGAALMLRWQAKLCIVSVCSANEVIPEVNFDMKQPTSERWPYGVNSVLVPHVMPRELWSARSPFVRTLSGGDNQMTSATIHMQGWVTRTNAKFGGPFDVLHGWNHCTM